MISELTNVPVNIAAFRAEGAVTKEDFEAVVVPVVKQKIARYGELNYLLQLNTELHNFTLGAWWQDAMLGLKNLSKWNRAAIVTDKHGIITFTELFSYIAPGEYKGFEHSQLEQALNWVATGRYSA